MRSGVPSCTEPRRAAAPAHRGRLPADLHREGLRCRDRRPELADLLHQAHTGDTIVVWRLDRLARPTRHLLDLVDALRERGIRLVTLHERLDTTSSTGQFIFTVFAALAELERTSSETGTRAKIGELTYDYGR